ncbi:MAG: NAD(P)/FAD-dependent oxidoreductase [Bacteroidota bacterium]|nr:NAD(P)/FAD-dependent oxidoreductase [Bacteroidota bacterium]
MNDAPPRILLVGAGLAGSLLSVYFARRGFHVDVRERRPDMRRETISAGRSINLALSTRGIHALGEVGLREEIMRLAIPMRGRMMHAVDGTLTYQPYGKDDSEVIYSVSRGELNRRMMDLAERHDGVTMRFRQRCDGMDLARGIVHFTDENAGTSYAVSADTVIASDGAGSAIRRSMEKLEGFDATEDFLPHGYKELHIPSAPDGTHRLEKHALHIWPRRSFMLIALPNLDGSFTCTLFLAQDGNPAFSSLQTPGDVENFFAKEFPDATALMPTLAQDFFQNPTGALGTVRCYPWHVGGTAALLGDAAHAIVPFYGQGMNCAFEDCTVLNECIEEFGTAWERVFHAYQERRKANADAIADLALHNFVEMRDRVADARFLLMKEVGLALETRFPSHFIPLYSMVTFHRTPYAVALQRGEIQHGILEDLTRDAASIADVDFDRARTLIEERLRPYAEESGGLY